jgi:PAS domain S-box-containing protein
MRAKPNDPDSLRAKAEKQLDGAPWTETSPRSTVELLHELQVHQVELEMQNNELRTAHNALEESRDRYLNLYEFAPVGYLTLTETGQIRESNLASTALLGLERNKLLRQRFDRFISPEDQDRWHLMFVRVMRNKEKMGIELALQRGDNSTPHVHLDCLHTENGSSREMHVALTDISAMELNERLLSAQDDLGKQLDLLRKNEAELRKKEEEINTLNRELEQRVAVRTADLVAANKELEEFTYSVSHDLRTPLRAIDGFSHILLEGYADKLDDEGKRLLNVVGNNAKRMGQLIDDILQFVHTSQPEIRLSDIDMEMMAHGVMEELQSCFADTKLQFEIEHIPPTRGDSTMMRKVFVYLLSNAVKFSRTSAAPRIKVGGIIEGDETVYYVKDNGVGFDMQYSDKLFGVFQHLHGINEFEGTGIGLAIVKRIVTRHNGRVWAEGKINEGATFYFALPAKEATHG